MFQKQEPLTPCRHILRNMKEIHLLPNWWFISIIPIYMVKNVELPTTLSSKFSFQKPTIARTVKNLAVRGLKKKDTASQRILMNGWPWEIIAPYHATSAVSIIVFFRRLPVCLGRELFATNGYVPGPHGSLNSIWFWLSYLLPIYVMLPPFKVSYKMLNFQEMNNLFFLEPSPYVRNKGRCSKLGTKMFANLCLPLYVWVACPHTLPLTFTTRSWKVCGSFTLIYFLILILGKIENVVVEKRLSPCVDTFKACHGWSRLGYCSSYSKERFMREYCKSSCNLCSSTDPDYTSTSCWLTFRF